MSHDRGCLCGKEKYEYEDCFEPHCPKTVNTIKTKEYVVGGQLKGVMHYIAFDQASGGYPYASKYLGERTLSLDKAHGWLDDARGTYCNIVNPKVFEIVLVAANTSHINKDEKEVNALIAKLTDQQKELMKKKLS